MEGAWYLKKRDLMLEARVRRVCLCRLQRKMVEQMATTQIGSCLRNDLGSFHGLSIPEGRSILAVISLCLAELCLVTYDCDANPLLITGIRRVLKIWRKT